jgi:cytoskeletal protein CcmA (bactofilin family)
MWNNKQDSSKSSASQEQSPSVTPINQVNPALSVSRPPVAAARNLSFLGPSLEIKGKISGEEDLQIDCKVEGPIALRGQKLIAGRSAQLQSEISAREIIVYGKVLGNLHAHDRVEIKKDGSVMGNITTARISIEDGAYFKGRIEIERSNSKSASVSETDKSSEPVPAAVG